MKGAPEILVALFAAGLGLAAATAAAQEMPSASLLADNCVPCHGPGGNSAGPATPTIAGLSRNYLVAALLAYKYGDDDAAIAAVVAEHPEVLDPDAFAVRPRTGTVMDRIAKGYGEAEIFALADYFSARTFVRRGPRVAAPLAEVGAAVHEARCGACHVDGGRSSSHGVGVLAGQWLPYLEHAMQDFLAGERGMPKKMASQVKPLDARDLRAVLQYYASRRE